MSSQHIDLDANYALDWDGRCITLMQKIVITGEGRGAHLVKKENIGKIKEVELGHYGKLDQVLEHYVRHAALTVSTDVHTLIAKLDELTKNLARFNVKCQDMQVATLEEVK